MEKTKKTFWYMNTRNVDYVTQRRVNKVTSTTPMVSGQLAEMIFEHCKGDKTNRKVTVTISGGRKRGLTEHLTIFTN